MNVLITSTILFAFLISMAHGACDKAKLAEAEAKMKELQAAGKEECKKNEKLANNNLNDAQIDYILNDVFPATMVTMTGKVTLPEGYTKEKVESIVKKSVAGCKSKMTGFNICKGDPSVIGKCLEKALLDVFGDETVWFAKNCNKVLDAANNADNQNEVKKVMAEKMAKIPQ